MEFTTCSSNENEDVKSTDVLSEYVAYIHDAAAKPDFSIPEACLYTRADELMLSGVEELVQKIGDITHLVVVGVGGSSLGLEALHTALGERGVKLLVLDTVSEYVLERVLDELQSVPLDALCVCSISKSGNTTETITNTDILLTQLAELHGHIPYERTVFVGDPEAPLLIEAHKAGAHVLPMHAAIGGRFSVTTAVGVLPLALLRHDYRAFLDGVQRVLEEQNTNMTLSAAQHIYEHMQQGLKVYNLFSFDLELVGVAKWYRQLIAESIGKEFDATGKPAREAFVPVLSTPVELHSVGQLYFSGFTDVLTEFLQFSDKPSTYAAGGTPLVSSMLKDKSMGTILASIQQGTVGAYEERGMPYHISSFTYRSAHDLGLYMGRRMFETMCLAKLLNVNPFDQPNVELYKKITRETLEK